MNEWLGNHQRFRQIGIILVGRMYNLDIHVIQSFYGLFRDGIHIATHIAWDFNSIIQIIFIDIFEPTVGSTIN